MITAKDIIKKFKMIPLDTEGGAFVRVYESDDVFKVCQLPDRYKGQKENKPYSTSILFLITKNSCSRMHRLPTDEVYHFYLGDPVEILELAPNGIGKKIIMGHDIMNGQEIQHTVKANYWQGSHLAFGGEFALLGTTMSPGYTNKDFEEGTYEDLKEKYEEFEGLIRVLTVNPPRFY